METIHTNPDYKSNWPDWMHDELKSSYDKFNNRVLYGHKVEPFAATKKAIAINRHAQPELTGKDKTVWLINQLLSTPDLKPELGFMLKRKRDNLAKLPAIKQEFEANGHQYEILSTTYSAYCFSYVSHKIRNKASGNVAEVKHEKIEKYILM